MKPQGVFLAGLLLVEGAEWFRARFSLSVSVGQSMEPALADPSLFVVDRAAHRLDPPCRGDIVVARHGGDWIVKRVVGLPGETVEVREGRVWINGNDGLVTNPIRPGLLRIQPGTLQPERYALLGDNRCLSAAESVHAVVGREQIPGRVVWSLPLSLRGRVSPALPDASAKGS